jgi:hypothetical protein
VRAGPGVFSSSHHAASAAAASGRPPRRRGVLRSRRAASAADESTAALRAAFLDMELAYEAAGGAPWAALDSAGVPFPDLLDRTEYSLLCAPL